LGGLAAIIGVVVLIIVQPGSGGTSSPEPETEMALPVAVSPDCLSSQIELTARTDQSNYSPGVAPQLWLRVTNISGLECTIAVGTDQQRYVVTSGDDEIWASDDCQTAFVPMDITLAPGEAQETTPLAWDRTRSATDTCEGNRPEMKAEGSSYHLTTYLGDIVSAETKQFLLD
jgi:hypothetical protein